MAMWSSLSLRVSPQNPVETLNKTPRLSPLPHPFRLSVPRSHSSSPIVSAQIQSQTLDLVSGRRDEIVQLAKESRFNCLSETHLDLTVAGLKAKAKGKVRDVYEGRDHLVLVTTDRQSAFDRVLASIPFKGQVLNETSLWWFNHTEHITPNAVVFAPDKNVTIAKKCSVFPVEFVVRGFVTGTTDTSLWTVYSKGVRRYCGNDLPEGMVKNQKLPSNILTPTTKATDHDVPVSPDEIFELGLMTRDEYAEVSSKALDLFAYGQQVALNNGLLLVDTKYEFGKDVDGTIMLIDEVNAEIVPLLQEHDKTRWIYLHAAVKDSWQVHTPDSSRYWISNSYEECFDAGREPENVDKEFLRLWFKEHCNPYEDEVLPEAPEELVCELAWRYIFLFETITNSKFELPSIEEPIHDRISRNVRQALSSL